MYIRAELIIIVLITRYRLLTSEIHCRKARIKIIMKRQYLPVDALQAWARLNSVTFHGVEIKQPPYDGEDIDKGSAVLAIGSPDSQEPILDEPGLEPEILMKVPPDLILSQERVETHAKSDKHLKDVLDAVGDFGKVSALALPVVLVSIS